ncbi:MAG TPA: biopolymer transporter ExbD [Steroidobacteraceae bacterium]|nr:biopolymer transporter ExbD [Steroidobacteraceae bacterium]
MAMNVGGDEGDSMSEINMTPLIDVMLVLLIIFIITIPVMTDAVKIDNPLPPPPNYVPPPPPPVINVSIDFDGTLSWNGTPVDRKTLQGYISEEAVLVPQPEVHITVDKFAKYDNVAKTLADLQSRGMKKIGFVNNNLFQ